MTEVFDVAIIGTGPAGVSAALPLVQRGLRVLMIDAGDFPAPLLPEADYLTARRTDRDQWRWMIGDDFYALRSDKRSSPKFRAPGLKNVFGDFAGENLIDGDGFDVVGAISVGGLSNAWGCGVARLTGAELDEYPFPESELAPSYETVARRIGISGGTDDDLSRHAGLDAWSQPPVELDRVHAALLTKYRLRSGRPSQDDFRLGRSRNAVITQDLGARKKCERLGTCLWGCSRDALYSAKAELASLAAANSVTVRRNFVAACLRRKDDLWTVEGRDRTSGAPLLATARTLFVAAGTLATARLVREALNLIDVPARLLSNPTAGFLLWFPAWFGIGPHQAFGLSQLSFALAGADASPQAWGYLFSTFGLPVSEFLDHVPVPRRFGIDLLKYLLPSSLVGNVFLPGALSHHQMRLNAAGRLVVTGGFSEALPGVMADIRKRLSRAFRGLGGVLPARGFLTGTPGSDVHYAGSVPMRPSPQRGETDRFGEVAGLPGVFVVDGASLPALSAKPHTMTIMANADRIAKSFVARRRETAVSDPT